MPHLTMRDGAPLHYHDLGRGRPVVLLHGFAMPAFLWLPFIAPLAASGRWRFILPDLRGFGGSHRLPLNGRCMLDQHASDLEDLLRGLDLHDVLLGGLSMGACTALQYHRRYGFGRIRAYLHMDQSPCVRNSSEWRHGLLGEEQESRLGQWQELMRDLEPWRSESFNRVPRELRRRLWSTLGQFMGFAFHKLTLRGFTALARHELLIRRVAPVANWPIYMDTLQSYLSEDYDWRPTLPQIDVPVTVLVGMRSTMYPPEGQLQIPKLVPRAQLVRFEGCGHAFPFEAPLKFVAELKRFLVAADADFAAGVRARRTLRSRSQAQA